jgi:hypothetical protein
MLVYSNQPNVAIPNCSNFVPVLSRVEPLYFRGFNVGPLG